jgi:hypothetical protein
VQTQLDDYTDGEQDPEWPPWDEYGPTMDEPLPVAEEKRQIWKERFRSAGICPNCLLEWASNPGCDYARADQHRPNYEEIENSNSPVTVRQDHDILD